MIRSIPSKQLRKCETDFSFRKIHKSKNFPYALRDKNFSLSNVNSDGLLRITLPILLRNTTKFQFPKDMCLLSP